MRLANQKDEIEAAGAEIIALSVDSQERSNGLGARWKLPFTFVSDPGGESFLREMDLYNPDERGGIALPAVVLINAEGEEFHREISNDFADRNHDDEALQALREADLPALETKAIEYREPSDEDACSGHFPPKLFIPLMNGNFYGARAISQRIDHEPSLEIVKEHIAMSKSFIEAWKDRKDS